MCSMMFHVSQNQGKLVICRYYTSITSTNLLIIEDKQKQSNDSFVVGKYTRVHGKFMVTKISYNNYINDAGKEKFKEKHVA